jgi:hypothetical protein
MCINNIYRERAVYHAEREEGVEEENAEGHRELLVVFELRQQSPTAQSDKELKCGQGNGCSVR